MTLFLPKLCSIMKHPVKLAFAAALIFGSALPLFSKTWRGMVVDCADGSSVKVTLWNCSSMQWKGDNLLIISPAGESLSIVDAISITYSTDSFDIYTSSPASDNISLSYDGSLLRLSAPDGRFLSMTLTSADGRTIFSTSGSGEIEASTSAMPAGCYVVQAGRKSFKIAVR